VALLAATGLGVWSADRAADALGLGGRAERQTARPGVRSGQDHGTASANAPARPAPASALTFGSAGAQLKGGLPLEAAAGAPSTPEAVLDELSTEAERVEASRMAESLRRLVRDLEYNRELPEPPQQTVVAAPEPWRPPAAETAPAPVIELIEPRSGPAAGGGRVTIRGQSLRPGQVMFGSAPARVVSVAAGAVTVVAPRGAAGPVAVAVTNEDGAFAVAGQPFTYVAR
jgi:hypothetical protein